MRSAHVACAEHVPRRIEPERGQVTEHFTESPPVVSGKEPRDVLHEHESRSHVSNDPAILAPEARPLARESGALSGEADVLAGEAAADEVDSGEDVSHGDASNGADVIIPGNVRPMLREHGPPELFLLDLPDTSTSRGVLNSEIEAPNTGEEAA